jgi:hypothetical protein
MYPGGATPNNGEQLHPRMGELRNGAYQQLLLPGAIMSSIGSLPARDATNTFV